jgi:ABC-type Na+ efflux pump permease subunit
VFGSFFPLKDLARLPSSQEGKRRLKDHDQAKNMIIEDLIMVLIMVFFRFFPMIPAYDHIVHGFYLSITHEEKENRRIEEG